MRVCELLIGLGAEVQAVDPHALSLHSTVEIPVSRSFTEEDARRADLTILLTDHDAFDYDTVAKSPVVLDTRCCNIPGAEIL